MGDIFDEIAGNTESATGFQGDIFDQIAGNVAPGGEMSIESISNQIGKGVSLGWFDEIQGLESGAQNAIANMFGKGNDLGFWQNYENKKNTLSQADAAFEATNPKTALALQFGGAAIPALFSGGLGLGARVAAEAPTLGRAAIANIFGVGGKSIPTVKQLATMGATGGAVFGAGEAEEGSRLMGAAKGAAAGAIAAPVIGKTVQVGANVIGDALSNRGIDIVEKLASERGSLSGRAAAASGYTPEELILAKQLKNTPLDKITAGQSELVSALDDGSPLFLPEAVNSPKANRNARFIANYEPSLEFSQSTINERAANAGSRLTEIFDAVSPQRNTQEGALGLSKAASNLLDSAEQAKLDAVKPLYDAAKEFTPTVDAPAVLSLLEKDGYLQAAVRGVKKSATNADLPDNSLEVLIQSKGALRDAVTAAKMAGHSNEARLIQKTYDTLHETIAKENPFYAEANAQYAKLSEGTSKLQESKLTFLSKIDPDNTESIGQIFKLPPERISELRNSFETAGESEAFSGGVRSHLQNLVDKSSPESNLLKKMIETPKQREQLQAALGESYDNIIGPLLREQKIFKGKGQYHAGSSTYGNFSEAEQFQKNIGLFSKIKNKDYMGVLTHMFSNPMPDDVAQKLAKIYFDPKTGADTLAKITPLLEQYSRNSKFAGALGKESGAGVAKQAAREIAEPRKKPSESAISSMFQKEDIKMDTSEVKPIKAIEQEIDSDPFYSALYEAESGRNPEAKNPESSASGGFQFIKSTAKAVGLDNPLDLGKSFEAVKKLTDENKGRFGDNPEDLYAAHYLGATVLQKLIDKKALTQKEQDQVNYLQEKALPRFMRIYNRINGTGQVIA